MLPFSDACERNKAPILAILKDAFSDVHSVLEIGSGTGQHAVYFARELPHLHWQPSDCNDYLSQARARVAAFPADNLQTPIELDVRSQPWPQTSHAPDAIFSANTLHIMSWEAVEAFFQGAGQTLPTGGLLIVYGPFRYKGQHTSDSNARFDQMLRIRDPDSGIRDFDAVHALAQAQNLALQSDHAMPANNRLLIWRRSIRTQSESHA